jgi:hypothetical protein
MKRTTPMKRTGFKARAPGDTPAKAPYPRVTFARKESLKTRQRAVTPEEKVLWDRLANEVGCVACLVAGLPTSNHVSIHHIDGRTKEGCHRNVLPLCAGHHQQGTGNDKSLVAVHPNKARFEKLYGTQEYLRLYAFNLLEVLP